MSAEEYNKLYRRHLVAMEDVSSAYMPPALDAY